MTAQHPHNDDRLDPQSTGAEPIESTDPIGPIKLPIRSRIGGRALALVGVVGSAAVGIVAATEACSTWPTIAE
ncbi:hypothetical protein GCM10009789_57460 [Kribbella sancticallisti]|uniref:Uncharacterized protein n=1 Tax=Kribbella sancticallisti TaxID=460087 RepID=A0ABP4Q2W8_9ACTN